MGVLSSTFDVIVAGGGPAGSSAARECARRGLSVVLADKAEFPRDKPCGGGVTIRCSRMLPFDLSPVSERDITSVRFTVPGATVEKHATSTLTYLTQRRVLDTFLLERAEEAGVRILQRSAVRAVTDDGTKFTVSAGSENLRARYLIAADGANGVTARLAAIPAPRWRGIALEGNITADPLPSRWRRTIGVDFGHIRGGYGWLFPKGDHVNIGLGGWSGSGPTLRNRLDRLVRWYGFKPEDLWNVRGHPLPVRRPGAPVASGRVLLVGDAAGFLDPFTGEGIFAAIWSGRSAAEHIAGGADGDEGDAATAYAREVQDSLLPDLRVSRKLADLFHVAPWLWTQGMRVPGIWQLASRLLTGEATYAGASQSSGMASSMLSGVYEALKLLSRMAPEEARWRPLLFAA